MAADQSNPTELPMREWLELGQALVDRRNVGQPWFRKDSIAMIEIGNGLKIDADGKTYRPGRYVLKTAQQDEAAQ